ncbi:hypothetical protein [Thermoclostridium stercorarium]|uniref:hypothetical protein n=1 Tax=Thermoclostridium stercorarium TaxID=1510 RepID=UPI000A984372
MKLWPDQKPYYSANQYFREIFGEKTYKISLDIGCTCPTRDGTKVLVAVPFVLQGVRVTLQ